MTQCPHRVFSLSVCVSIGTKLIESATVQLNERGRWANGIMIININISVQFHHRTNKFVLNLDDRRKNRYTHHVLTHTRASTLSVDYTKQSHSADVFKDTQSGRYTDTLIHLWISLLFKTKHTKNQALNAFSTVWQKKLEIYGKMSLSYTRVLNVAWLIKFP